MYQRGTGDNCDKRHLSSRQEKSTSNKGDVIVAFKRHALNFIPSRQLEGKRANSAKTSVWLQSWVHECYIVVSSQNHHYLNKIVFKYCEHFSFWWLCL